MQIVHSAMQLVHSAMQLEHSAMHLVHFFKPFPKRDFRVNLNQIDLRLDLILFRA